jgi:hypothetical protein
MQTLGHFFEPLCGKRLPTGARRVIKIKEGRPGKVRLHYDQGAHKGAEGKFHEDGDGG